MADDALARARRWASERTFSRGAYPAATMSSLRGSSKLSVAVVIPTREVASTIEGVVVPCAALLAQHAIDELFVVDAGSTDGTAEIAARAGAEVFQEAELLPEQGPVCGKGDAMWRSLSVVTSDVVVFVDGDTREFDVEFVSGLACPLLDDASLQLVKGSFARPFTDGDLRVENGGGRVNELVARPLLNIYFPELAAVNQPLAGEFAARTAALRGLPFRTGYGVEIQLLIDIYEHFGLDAIAQSELGERLNSHQSLNDLGPMAYAVARTLLERAGQQLDSSTSYLGSLAGAPDERTVDLFDRQPLDSILVKPTVTAADGA